MVMKNLKSSLYGMVLSPILIDHELPDLIFCWSKIGSSAGSRDWPQFSRRIHLPNWIASSIVLKREGSEGFKDSRGFAFFDPRFLMNLFA